MIINDNYLDKFWYKNYFTTKFYEDVKTKFIDIFNENFKKLQEVEEGSWGNNPIFWESVIISEEKIIEEYEKDFYSKIKELDFNKVTKCKFIIDLLDLFIEDVEGKCQIRILVGDVTGDVIGELKEELYNNDVINFDGDLIKK